MSYFDDTDLEEFDRDIGTIQRTLSVLSEYGQVLKGRQEQLLNPTNQRTLRRVAESCIDVGHEVLTNLTGPQSLANTPTDRVRVAGPSGELGWKGNPNGGTVTSRDKWNSNLSEYSDGALVSAAVAAASVADATWAMDVANEFLRRLTDARSPV